MAAAIDWQRLARVPSPSPVRPSSVYTLTNKRFVPSSSTMIGLTAVIFTASRRAAEAGLEPAQDAFQEVDAVLGYAARAEEQMRAAWVARELDVAARRVEGHEHLLTLTQGAALVRLTVNDQCCRLRTVGKG